MRSIRWIVLVGLIGSMTSAVGAQSARRPIEVGFRGGANAPLTEFGTVGVARGKETVSPTVGITLAHDLGRALTITASADWVWDVGTRVRPTPACTQRCDPGVISGGRIAIVLATLSWHLPTPVGLFSFEGGAGLKSYRNGGAITACYDQFCFDAGAYQESLTNVAGQVGIGWRPRATFPVGLHASNVVSRYKTGRQQHNLLLLLELHVL